MPSRNTILALLLIAAAAPLYLSGQVTPTVTFNKKFAPPTAKVLVSGKGFSAGSSILIQFDQSPIGQAHTDANGTFTKAVVKIPGRVTEGSHVFGVSDSLGIGVQIGFLIETDWPQQRFDPGNTANNPYEWKLDTTTVKALAPAWNTLGRPGPCVGTTAIVSGRRVYFNNNNVGLQALDPDTGNLLWGLDTSANTKANCGTSPTATLGAGHLVSLGNAKREVWAISTITRAKVWMKQPGFGIFVGPSWPISVGNALFVGDSGGNLASLNQFNGLTNWFLANSFNGYVFAYNNGVLYTSSPLFLRDESDPVGYSAKNGLLKWSYTVPTCGKPLAAYSVVTSGTVAYYSLAYNSCSKFVPSALDVTANNTLMWQAPFSGGFIGNPALSSGLLYLTDYYAIALDALNRSDLSIAWQLNGSASDPIIANGVVYVGFQTGDCNVGTGVNYVEAIDASIGTGLWATLFPGSCVTNAPPVPSAVVDGTLYVTNSTDGATSDLWAFR